MDQKLKDLRARCWARYTDQRESFEVKQIMLEVVKMIDAMPAELAKLLPGDYFESCRAAMLRNIEEQSK